LSEINPLHARSPAGGADGRLPGAAQDVSVDFGKTQTTPDHFTELARLMLSREKEDEQ